MHTRRDVLLQLSALGAGLVIPGPHHAWADDRVDYALPEWTGDRFAEMHAVRDENGPRAVPKADRRVEVAIVGGGLAGLAVATLLGDAEFLVLERETTMGGNAKAGLWRGIEYALGSAYLVDTEEPYGSFYESLGLTLTPVVEPVNRVLAGGADRGDGLEGALRQPFAELVKLMVRQAKAKDFPDIPIERATSRALAYDQRSFSDFLRGEQIAPSLMPMLDAYCRSSLGGGVDAVSAYAGINFLSEIGTPIYAFPGGNAALATAMAAKINRAGSGRLASGASVFAIEADSDGRTLVGYLDHANGASRAVSARWVVVAAPYFFAARIIRGLDPVTAAFMRDLSYGSYLVANCCFSGRQLSGSYDTWTPDNPGFTDFVTASAVLPASSRPRDREVLTVYAPFADSMAGRAQLLAGDRASAAGPVVEGLRRFAPDVFTDSRLEEVRLTRYGHQVMSSRVGLVSAMRQHPKRFGNIVLAHSDGQAMAAVESAITEAHRAAKIILQG